MQRSLSIRFLPDEPIENSEDDQLGLGEFVDLIYSSIQHTDTPFVYGVLGDWGVGKTSILQMLNNRYGDFNADGINFVPIWFNAWQYENETNIVYPLLYSVKKQYEKDVADKGVSDANFFEKLWEVGATSTLALSDIGLRLATKHLSGVSLSVKDLKSYLDDVKQSQSELEAVLSQWADSVGHLKNAFADLMEIYAKGIAKVHKVKPDTIRFLILVDDLDRCLPETTISVLESVKNHLTVPNTVFVLGLNPRVVYQGIKHKYHSVDVNGREYLEKILNYTFYVPEPDMDYVRTFAVNFMRKLVSTSTENEFEEHFISFGQTLHDCRFNNPRKIKRILNRFLLFVNKHYPDLESYSLGNVVRLIILSEYFPELFRFFLSDADSATETINSLGETSNTSAFDISRVAKSDQIWTQLFHVKTIVKGLKQQKDLGKKKLKEEVQAVFHITRFV